MVVSVNHKHDYAARVPMKTMKKGFLANGASKPVERKSIPLLQKLTTNCTLGALTMALCLAQRQDAPRLGGPQEVNLPKKAGVAD